MIKKFPILILLIGFKIFSQENQIVYIDRFENDKNDWGLTTSKKWDCAINNGKLIIENKNDNNWCYFDSKNITNLENKAKTEINFDFQIEGKLTKYGGGGFVFINDKNSQQFERVRLLINSNITYFDKESWAYPDGSYVLGNSFKTPELKEKNSVRIILNNTKNVKNGEQLIFILNDQRIFSSKWPISNFNKIGFIVQASNRIKYDNLVIKQSKESNLVEDSFDYIFIDNKQHIDHNGIEASTLIEYIPIEIVNNTKILSTKELIKSLKKNNKCSNIETKKVDFKGKKREMFSFNYGNSLIEFFTDTDKPNPIIINFLEIKDLDAFFKIYSDYNSYRYEGNRAQWPSNPWFSILKDYDSYKATIWRGM